MRRLLTRLGESNHRADIVGFQENKNGARGGDVEENNKHRADPGCAVDRLFRILDFTRHDGTQFQARHAHRHLRPKIEFVHINTLKNVEPRCRPIRGDGKSARDHQQEGAEVSAGTAEIIDPLRHAQTHIIRNDD